MKDVIVECTKSDAEHFFVSGNYYAAKQLKSGCLRVTDKYGVAHKTGKDGKIVCWIRISGREIVGLVSFEVQEDKPLTF